MTQKIKVKIITFTPEAPLQATRGLWENVVFYDISEDVFACLLACLLAVCVCAWLCKPGMCVWMSLFVGVDF